MSKEQLQNNNTKYTSLIQALKRKAASGDDMLQTRVNITNSCDYLFYNYGGTNVDFIKNLDTSNVTNMNSMFEDAVNVEHLNVSSFDTTKVSDMSGMFMNCTKLKELDLSNFTTNNVTNIRYMFYNCQSLESLNLSGWDLTTVISLLSAYNYEKILYGCPKLASLYLNECNYETVKHILSLIRGINGQYKYSLTERCGNGNSIAYCDESLRSKLSTFVLPDGWTIEYN